MLVKSITSGLDEVHVNPRQIVDAWESDGRYRFRLSNGVHLYETDRESYDRIVAWMKRQDG